MKKSFVSSIPLREFTLWEKIQTKRSPASFNLEVTARCNNNCRHCYINLPAGDRAAMADELSFEAIRDISDEAFSLGALWCLISGGEPLLRNDFSRIYLYLKKKGFLISVYTNAAMVAREHVAIFKKHPPRDIEVTVYGATKKTYERVTRVPGSFEAFKRGLALLLDNGVHVRLKAMALRSNVHEMEEIAEFCRKRTKDYFRFDPSLHLRYDRNQVRNREIREERLTACEITALERSDSMRFQALEKQCGNLLAPGASRIPSNRVFYCGAALNSFCVSPEGRFRLCSSLCRPDCEYDLTKGTLTDAWRNFALRVREFTTDRKDFLETCGCCSLLNLCMWCPAHADLETGELDGPVDYFCDVAHARVKAIMGKSGRLCSSGPGTSTESSLIGAGRPNKDQFAATH